MRRRTSSSAVELHATLFREDKHLPRLNILHNFGIHKATGAGYFLPQRVRMFRMKGRLTPVVFADLMAVKDEVFQSLCANDLPYCSVEVREWEPLQFGALALLDTEPPFFEFPLITIGEESVSVTADVTRFQENPQEPAVAAFVAGASSRFLFRFGAEDMPEEPKKDDDEVKAEFEGEGGMSVESIVKAIESGEISVADMEAIVAAIGARGDGAEEEEVVEPAAANEGPPVEFQKDEEKPEFKGEERTAMLARVSALEDFRAATENEKAVNALFSSAVKGLEDEGHHLSDNSRKRLREAAEKGEETLALFTTVYREEVPRDPPEDLDGLPAGMDTLPDEVAQFSGRGPEALAEAKRVWREWAELKDTRAFGSKVTPLDRYLARNVKVGG